jgi:tetratricopeptide (TPR) repeat protein
MPLRRNLASFALIIAIPAAAGAQQPASADSTVLFRALDLEGAGKYKEAAPLFRAALRTPSAVSALLGLERVYAELGWADSLLSPLDTLIQRSPREPMYRTVQLRTLQALGREADLRRAFERWTKDMPTDPSPYREMARILLQRNQTSAADSVIRRARSALGRANDLQLEIAQLRAAMGLWQESAVAWRQALVGAPYLEQAAVYALTPTPAATRQAVRQTLLDAPIEVGARRVLADLETGWGAPAQGWEALRPLTPDSASAEAWTEFADRAEAEERWALAREALSAALKWKATTDLSVRAARAALNAGDAEAAMTLAPLSQAGNDSTRLAQVYVPIHARALAMIGRPEDAAALAGRVDKWLTPATRVALTRIVAWGWVRSGDMVKARAALSAAGVEGDSSDTAGWLALYEGDLKTARALLRAGAEATPELALALGLVARLRVDRAPEIGKAFLSLARADTTRAAAEMAEAADRYPDGASLLLLTAAQLRFALKDESQAIVLWQRVVEQQGATPEAPQAELEWARALRRKGEAAAAVAHLEHLILTYPQSALVPQARRELELARSSIPGSS